MKIHSAAFSVLFLLCASSAAAAPLLGTTVNTCWNTVFNSAVTTDTGVCDLGTVGFASTSALIVDPGNEFSIGSGRVVDFTDTTVTVRYNSFSGSPSPDLFIFTDLPSGITGLTLLTGNSLGVTTAFTTSSIALLVGSPECCPTSTAEVTFSIDYGSSSVPEPSTYLLGAAGLALTAALRRRR